MSKVKSVAAVVLLLALLACGGSSFATQLRGVLAASTPLIDSLNLGDKRAAVVADFADLATAAGHLADDLKVCGKSKPCSLDAMSVFEVRLWDVERRGHFKLSPKLENIKTILGGIVSAAKVYYGAQTVRTAGTGQDAEQTLKDRLEQLKAAMKP